MCVMLFFFFKQKTAYEMRISDWSSDVCSSDLAKCLDSITVDDLEQHTRQPPTDGAHPLLKPDQVLLVAASERIANDCGGGGYPHRMRPDRSPFVPDLFDDELRLADIDAARSEEHTSELQSLMRISYAVFCLK